MHILAMRHELPGKIFKVINKDIFSLFSKNRVFDGRFVMRHPGDYIITRR